MERCAIMLSHIVILYRVVLTQFSLTSYLPSQFIHSTQRRYFHRDAALNNACRPKVELEKAERY